MLAEESHPDIHLWNVGIGRSKESDGGDFGSLLACHTKLVSGGLRPSSPCRVLTTWTVSLVNSKDVAVPCSAGQRDVSMCVFHGGNNTILAYLGGEHRDASACRQCQIGFTNGRSAGTVCDASAARFPSLITALPYRGPSGRGVPRDTNGSTLSLMQRHMRIGIVHP